MTPPQAFAGFTVESPAPAASVSGFSGAAYLRRNPPQALTLSTFEALGLSDNQMNSALQAAIATAKNGLVNPQMTTQSNGDTAYTCLTGVVTSGSAITQCVARPTAGFGGPDAAKVEGQVIFTIGAVPAMDPAALVALAQQAQAAITVG